MRLPCAMSPCSPRGHDACLIRTWRRCTRATPRRACARCCRACTTSARAPALCTTCLARRSPRRCAPRTATPTSPRTLRCAPCRPRPRLHLRLPAAWCPCCCLIHACVPQLDVGGASPTVVRLFVGVTICFGREDCVSRGNVAQHRAAIPSTQVLHVSQHAPIFKQLCLHGCVSPISTSAIDCFVQLLTCLALAGAWGDVCAGDGGAGARHGRRGVHTEHSGLHRCQAGGGHPAPLPRHATGWIFLPYLACCVCLWQLCSESKSVGILWQMYGNKLPCAARQAFEVDNLFVLCLPCATTDKEACEIPWNQ